MRTTYASVLISALCSVSKGTTILRLKYAYGYILYHHKLDIGIIHVLKSSLVVIQKKVSFIQEFYIYIHIYTPLVKKDL